jgi:nucleotide-binding universal stress UspA family protein
MYERLLVAVDHSEITGRVLAAARQLALLSEGEVWVLHLREREVIPKSMALMARESGDEAQAAVQAAVDELARAGVSAHGEVRNTIYGYAAREIIDDANVHDAGLIVMGSRGRGDLAGLILGSTAHKVLQLCDRPVLIVR